MSRVETAVAEASVRVVTDADSVSALSGAWEHIWRSCQGNRTPFLSFAWVQAWLRHYGATIRPYVLVVEQNCRVVCIMPLAIASCRLGGFGLNVLETLGGQSRNIVALVAPGTEQVAARAVAAHLLSGPLARGVCIRLDLVPSGTPFLDGLSHLLSQGGAAVSVRDVSRAPYVPLPALWDDYLQSLGRRRRKVLGRAQRSLDRVHRDQVVRWLQSEEVPAGMEHLFRLHQERWSREGIRGLFSDADARSFHLDVARSFDRLGWLSLSLMELDGRTVSAHLAVVLDRTVYLLRSGRDPSLGAYSIGHLHELRLFRYWIAAGMVEADLLRGAEPYKFYWTRNYRTYVQLLAAARPGPSRLVLETIRAWLWLVTFLQARHSPRELLAYISLRWTEARERRKMGIEDL